MKSTRPFFTLIFATKKFIKWFSSGEDVCDLGKWFALSLAGNSARFVDLVFVRDDLEFRRLKVSELMTILPSNSGSKPTPSPLARITGVAAKRGSSAMRNSSRRSRVRPTSWPRDDRRWRPCPEIFVVLMHLFTVLGRQCVEGLNKSHYRRCRRNQKKQQQFVRFSHVAGSCKPDIRFPRTTRLKKYFDGEVGSTASIRFSCP